MLAIRWLLLFCSFAVLETVTGNKHSVTALTTKKHHLVEVADFLSSNGRFVKFTVSCQRFNNAQL